MHRILWDLDFNVHMDLSLNNNCTNVEVQNTCTFSDTEKSTKTKGSDASPKTHEENVQVIQLVSKLEQ